MANAPPLLQLADIRLTFGGHAAAGGRGAVGVGGRARVPGRAQRLGQIDPAADRGRADRARPGERFVQPGAAIRYLPQEPDLSGFADDARLRRGGPRARPTIRTRRATCCSSSASTAPRTRPTSRAASCGGRRSRACWRPSPTSSCSTSRPTISICRRSSGWRRQLSGRSGALVLISHDRRFLENLSRITVWLDRGSTRRVELGFGRFEAWRDEQLAEEEAAQHKLDRKIVREEHWVRYGVTARRKRNVRRMAALQGLRQARRDHRKGAGKAVIEATEAQASGTLVIEAKAIAKSFGAQPIVSGLLHAHPARRPHRHRRAQRQRQDHARQPADRRAGARCRHGAARRQPRDGERSISTARASIPTGPCARR